MAGVLDMLMFGDNADSVPSRAGPAPQPGSAAPPSQEDIDRGPLYDLMIKGTSEPYTSSTLPTKGRPAASPEIPEDKRVSAGQAALEGALKGASFNFRDEWAGMSKASGLPSWLGGFRAPVGAAKVAWEEATGDPEREAIGAYVEGRNEAQDLQRRAAEQNPTAFHGAELGAQLAMPQGAAARGASAGVNALRYGATQGLYAGLAGAGEGESGGDRIDRAVTGAVVGVPIGAAGGAMFGKGPDTGNMRELVRAATNTGVRIPLGAASDSRAVNAATMALAQAPGIGPATISKSMSRAREDLGTATDRAAQMLVGGGAVPDRAVVGAGARDALENVVSSNDRMIDTWFNNLRKVIDADAKVALSNDVVAPLTRIVDSRAAAGSTSKYDISGLEKVANVLTDPEGATFNGLQRARTELAKLKDWDNKHGGFLSHDISDAYAGLSKAMEESVRGTAKINPNMAVDIWRTANDTFAENVTKNREIQRFLRHGSDEQIVDRIVRWGSNQPGAGDIQRMLQMRNDIPKSQWDNIAAYTVQRLSTSSDGSSSPQYFVKRYEQLSDQAKDLLFGPGGTRTRQFIDDINTVSNKLKNSERYINTSNTAGGFATLGMLGLTGASTGYFDPREHVGELLGGGAVAVILSRPATAASYAAWTNSVSRLIRAPSAVALASFNLASRNFANNIGDALGVKDQVAELRKGLMNLGSSAKAGAQEGAEPIAGVP